MPEKATSQPVSIRLDAETYDQLTKEAARRGVSPGEQLKHLATEVLKDRDRQRVFDELEALQAEVRKLTNRVDRLDDAVIDLEDEVGELQNVDGKAETARAGG